MRIGGDASSARRTYGDGAEAVPHVAVVAGGDAESQRTGVPAQTPLTPSMPRSPEPEVPSVDSLGGPGDTDVEELLAVPA